MTLLILTLIFVATLICNALGVLFQRAVQKERHLKATTISVLMAGISLLIWKGCLAETDLTSSVPAIVAYLVGDAVGVYAGFKISVDNTAKLAHK